MHKTISVHGANSTEAFIEQVERALGLAPASTTLSALKARIEAEDLHLTVRWGDADAARGVQVRKSDVPLDSLPSGGSNMLRDIVLDLVYAQCSLYDKVTAALSADPRITLVV